MLVYLRAFDIMKLSLMFLRLRYLLLQIEQGGIMQFNTLESKVSIFISSKCGGRYSIVRKALKDRLEDTCMTRVYAFETSPGSSAHLTDAYLKRIDESDLCVILVDNKDGVTDPVLREQKRAKSLNKKLLYVFCDEKKKKTTQMQLEIQQGDNEKYSVVHEFSDITDEAFRSVMQDIAYTYKDRDGIHNENGSVDESVLSVPSKNVFKIDKELFKGFDLTKNELFRLFGHYDYDVKDTSEIDILCKDLLRVILGLDFFDVEQFEKLAKLITQVHEENIRSCIQKRLFAVKNYFSGDLDGSITALEAVLEEADSNPVIPNWLTNDIAIDLRNAQQVLDETKNQIQFESKGQKYITNNSEPLYYPLIDRADDNLKARLLDKYFSFNTDSPYTTQIGGLEEPLTSVAYCFYISVVYGSITHALITRKRLIDLFITLCSGYDDHCIYVELMGLLVLERRDKDIGLIIRKYNLSVDIVNSNDIDTIWNKIKTTQFRYRRFVSLCLLVKHFGYYFSDVQYKTVTEELDAYMKKWFVDEQRIFNVVDYYIKMLKENIYRIAADEICEFCCDFLNTSFSRWFDDCFSLLSMLNYEGVNNERQEKVLNCLTTAVKDEKQRQYGNGLQSALIRFRKTAKIDCQRIDNVARKEWESFYLQTYSLEVFDNDDAKSFEFILGFLNKMEERNANQGLNGTYSGYGDDPYGTIHNIIEINHVTLELEQLSEIIRVAKETLLAPRQDIGSKISAIKLLMYLINRFPASGEWKAFFDCLIDSKTEVITGHEDGLFEKDTLHLLEFNYNLLLTHRESFQSTDILRILVDAGSFSDYEIIKALNSIKSYLYRIDYFKMDSLILATIFQYTASQCFKDERDIRFFSVELLIQLTNSPIQELALQQLSMIMDTGTGDIKTSILSRVKKIASGNQALVAYILQKGKVDTNYLVRRAAINNFEN